MKKVSILLSIFCILAIFSQAQKFTYPDSWGNAGFNLTDSRSGSVQVVHSIREFELNPVNVNGITMKNVNMPGSFLPGSEGLPNLPGNGRYIAIPTGAVPHLQILSQRTEIMHHVEVAPAPRIPTDLQPDFPLQKNQEVYSTNANYPESPVKISEVQQIRGVNVVILGITPFQYNPVTKDLTVYRDLKVEITFEGGNGQFGDVAFRSPWWDPIMQDNILNQASLPVVDYSQRLQSYSKRVRDTECEYIIITPTGPSFLAWADSVKNFRNQQGILTRVFTIDEVGGNTVDAIEAFVDNAYNTWNIKPVACLLLGDYGSDATKNITSYLYYDHPDGYNPYPSDNKYADVNGDEMPEVVFSRIVANDATQLQVLVSKFLDYERNPPTDPLFYSKPISALGWQTERWFQLCSEIVGGYFRTVQGKTPRRINAIYSGTTGSIWSSASNTSTITNYFGPSGLSYIPATPSELGGWSGGNATRITQAIDSGAFILVHRDHGMYSGWGEPAYTTSNIGTLNNTLLPFVFSINCQTGAFHKTTECFGEKFVRYTKNGHNAGALGIVCPSETSYSFVNDTFVWGMFDNMFPNFMPAFGTTPPSRGFLPAFGNAAGKYFLKQSNWPSGAASVKTVTYRLFHMLGEAFQVVYTEVPQQLAVTHGTTIDYGSTTFPVQANEGALISLTVNNEIIAIATGIAGGPVNIPIPDLEVGTQVVVTVTKQNYFRYSGTADVVSIQLISNFSASPTNLCMGSGIEFADLSTGNPESWEWSFPGGSPSSSTNQQPGIITYATAGNYDVTLTVLKTGSDPATTTKTAYIHSFEFPEAGFTPSAACPGELSSFTDVSNPHGSTIVSWKWIFGDPASGSEDTAYVQNPTHLYVTPGNYAVSLLVTTVIGCTNEYSQPVVIPDLPGTAADPTGPVTACQGEPTLAYTTTGASDATSYTWTLTPTEAGTISGTEASITMNLDPGFTGSFSIKVKGVNDCGKGEYSADLPVNVLVNPVAPGKPAGADSVNLNKVISSEFTISEVPDATSYSWILAPAEAGTISGDGLTGTVIWTPTFKGTASISASATNQDCPGPVSELKEVIVYAPVGIGENGKLGLNVYPNPTSGKFSLDILPGRNISVNIIIYNAIGNIVYQDKNVSINGKLHLGIDLSALPGGIYLLKVEGDGSSNSTRIVIGK